MSQYLFIRRTFQGAYAIHTDVYYTEHMYFGYSKRDAVKKFRQDHGLVGKHLQTIET